MTTHSQSSNTRRIWWVILLIWVGCGLFGAYTLATSPREMIRFWDEADLALDLKAAHLADADSQEGAAPSYVVRKIGYAYPLKVVRDWFGEGGYDIYNLLLWVVLLILPIPGVKPQWLALLLKACALSALPFTVKYVSMLNPTLQSMMMWLALATVLTWWSQMRERRGARYLLSSFVIGLVGGGLVLTDFKWLPFALAAIGLTVLWTWYCQRTGEPASHLETTRGVLRWVIDGTAMLIWIPIVMLLVALVHPPYGRMVYAMTFTLPQKLDVIRWGVCSNVLVHLWYLGGLAFVVGTVVLAFGQGRSSLKMNGRFAPYWICAGLIVVVFTVVLWPRCARMFVSALVLLIPCGVAAVVHAFEAQPRKSVGFVSWVGIGLMTLSLLINVVHVPDALNTPTGLDALKRDILSRVGRSQREPRIDPPYVANMNPLLMRARVGTANNLSWLSPVIGLSPRVKWAVTNLALDQYMLDEQVESSSKAGALQSSAYSTLTMIYERGQSVVSIPAPYFSTPYYVCETTYENGRLIGMLNADLPSEWQLTYIGMIHGISQSTEGSP